MDYTLPDDAWKDSFDKLLDTIPRLRELNVLKPCVRAEYNIDSSVENSNSNVLSVSDYAPEHATVKDTGTVGRIGLKLNSRSISTPATKRLNVNLFDCAISPITGIKLDGFNKNVLNKRKSCSDQLDILAVHTTELQPKPRKRVCFELSASSIGEKPVENSLHLDLLPAEQNCRKQRSFILKPGKWRKSLCNWRRTQLFEPARLSAAKQSLPANEVAADHSLEYVGVIQMPGRRKSVYIKEEPNAEVSPEGQVLKYCGQCKALRFDKTYTPAKMPKSFKIGEGVYGEVFKYTAKNADFVLKIIPIQGSMQINGEPQKTYEQILPEIIISKEMCNLRINRINSTAGFVDIHKVALVMGNYPKHLIELWEKYDDDKESENDHPEVFTAEQLFVVLELKFAGEDMSKFTFLNAEQAYYAFLQIILTLAVGEQAYQFEHRDLHWGNILIEATDKKQIAYKLDGKSVMVPTKGVKTTIIDYTLSRITFDECCYYNDLSTDEELFSATGDYQYDIYRMMRDELKNDWTKFAPKTNVMWLSYVGAKLMDGVKYKSVHTKKHITYMKKLQELQKVMLVFDSAANCAKNSGELM